MDTQTTIGLLVSGYVPLSGAVVWLTKELIKSNRARMEDKDKATKEILKATNKMVKATLKETKNKN